MSAPNIIAGLASLAEAIAALDKVLQSAIDAAPDAVKPELEAAKAAVDNALALLNLADVQSSIIAAAKVIESGHGVTGGGADATSAAPFV